MWRLGCHQHNPSTVTARLRRHMHVAQFAQNYTEYRRYSLVAFRHKGRIKHSTSAPTFPCRNHALRLPTNAGTKRTLVVSVLQVLVGTLSVALQASRPFPTNIDDLRKLVPNRQTIAACTFGPLSLKTCSCKPMCCKPMCCNNWNRSAW